VSTQIVQWGCGRWGANVLRDLLHLGARVTVVARGEDSVRRAREGGAHVVVRDIGELDGVDGIVIVTPAPHHAEAIRRAAGLSCPIFCEKPLVTDASCASELLELCGERLYVMHKWRWHPGIETLAALAADGTLGTVTGVRSARLGWGPWHFGVDSIDTLMPHDLSIGIAILGRIPPLVAASGTPHPGLDGGYVDTSALFLDEGGALTVECSGVSAHRIRRVEVTGTSGSATLPEPEAARVELLVHNGDLDGEIERHALPVECEWPLLRELRDFVRHCEGGPPPRATGAEGFEVIEAIASLRDLLAQGERIA
jgi:predicted dehydrogenase